MNFEQRFVCLDIESTGLTYEYWDEPTEIAAIEIINKKITGTQKHYYLKPKKKINVEFLEKIFGKNILKETKQKDIKSALTYVDSLLENDSENEKLISQKNEIIRVKKEASEMFENIEKGGNKYKILVELREFIGDAIVVAHNAFFDVNFLNYWFNELGLDLIQNYICTFVNFKNYYQFKENNLTACCNYYNIELLNAHNALDDTKACAELFLAQINDFPNDLIVSFFEKEIAYANFKKRVVKTKYCDFMRLVLSSPCNLPENIEDLSEVEVGACENLFFKFKKPIDVSNITGLDLGSVDSIFVNWVNCININKHLDLIKDKYLISTVRDILKLTNLDYKKIRDCHIALFETEPNYFFYKLIEKLDYKKDSMQYDLNDFDYYFTNLKSLDDLCKKIDRKYDYILPYLISWINTDNSRFLKYKNFIKENYKISPKKDIEIYMKDAIDNSKNKEYILKQLGII